VTALDTDPVGVGRIPTAGGDHQRWHRKGECQGGARYQPLRS
jgi:hypothetical protein